MGEDEQTALHYAAKYRKMKGMRKGPTMDSNLADAADGDGDHPTSVVQVCQAKLMGVLF